MTVLNCFLAGTLRVAALTLGMLSAPGLANAQQTTVCASENEWCSLPASTAYWQTSYGSADNKFVVTTQNVAQIPCSNTSLGIPDYELAKRCSYKELSEKPAETFQWCANEHGVCNNFKVAAGKYRVVRYGSPIGDRWLYNNVSGAVVCELGKFYNFDPAPNVNKICQVSTTDINPNGTQVGGPKWIWCAKESFKCTPEAGAVTYLIRYGLGDDETGTWLYRTVVGTGIKCNPSTFGYDPADGQNKQCWYLPMSTVVPARPGVLTNPWNGSILPQGAQIRLRSTVQYVVQRDPIAGGYSQVHRDVPNQRLLDVEPNAVGAVVLAPEGSVGSLFTVTTWSPADDPGQNTCQRIILQAPGGMFVTFGWRRYAASAAMSEAAVFCLDRTQAPRAQLWDAGYKYSQREGIEPSFASPNYLFRDGKYSAYVTNDVYEQPSFLGFVQGVPASGTFEVFVP